jgi:hypothetical protein
MLRYWFARDLVEDSANVTADVSLQIRGQTAGSVDRFLSTRGIQLVGYARHFSPPILAFGILLHNRFQMRLSREIQDKGFSKPKGAKTPKPFNWFHLLEPGFLPVRFSPRSMWFLSCHPPPGL